MAAEGLSEGEQEYQWSVQQSSSSEIKEILQKWRELQTFVKKTHPEREESSSIHLLNNIRSCFLEVESQ